jgi:hypothetical protein
MRFPLIIAGTLLEFLAFLILVAAFEFYVHLRQRGWR